MELRFSKEGRRKESRPAKRSFFSRVKGKALTAVLVAGMALGVAACKTTGNKFSGKTNSHQAQKKKQKAHDNAVFDGCKPSDYDCECRAYPAIEKWAKRRSLDPLLVRAFIKTESAFQPHAAAKVCGPVYDDRSCFQHGPSADPGYHLAFDEMYIPQETDGNPSQLANDIAPAGKTPRWRWLSFGLMQNLEPPVSFWPASHRSDSKDGEYHDVLKRAGLSGPPSSLDLDSARACNPQFNPFDIEDSLCLGTKKLKYLLAAARAWIWSNRDKLNWNVYKDTKKTNLLAIYIAANKYSGLWDMSGKARESTNKMSAHPRCSPSLRNGDCWAIGFKISWQVFPGIKLDKAYCESAAGKSDMQCKDGKPHKEPPAFCYGYNDFMKFVQECEVPFLPTKRDLGAVKLKAYLDLKQKCK